MTSPFQPRTVASVHTIGCRLTPTHQEPEAEPEESETEDETVDEERVQAKVVSSPRRKPPRTTQDTETK